MEPKILVILRRDSKNLKTALLKCSEEKEAKYLSWLKRQPLSQQTKRAYASRINRFLTFLDASGEVVGRLMENERERAHVVREYKRHLKVDERCSPATVNAHLTAIDHFFQFQGASNAKIAREDLPQEAPRALSKSEQKRFLRAVAACRRSKDRAVALLLLYTGIRISECAQLNEQDISIAGRRQRIVVRSGKGERYREIPLNAEAREALREWLQERNIKFEGLDHDDALFKNPQGRRLSTSSLDLIVRKIGESCGLSVSAHVLRHTCLTNLVRNGSDLVLVAEIGGHRRLETTRRYTLPTATDKEIALEKLSEL
ncbi:MAG: tyrosine-type recombinase/integrase [Candidatus Obscuribacterales bacterium]|nr:tyrosine-type recombinase/integrase [Candidatus Obscuribacterales bacterium]